MITNSNDDFLVSPEGMSIKSSTSFIAERALSVKNGSTNYGGLWGHTASTKLLLESQPNIDLDVISIGSGNVRVRAVTGNLELSTNLGSINIRRNDASTIIIGSTITVNSALALSPGSGTAYDFTDTRSTFSRNLRVRNVTEGNRNTPTPQPGDIIFNTTTNRFNGWNGSEWRNLE